jgi:Protein kinase domain
MGDTLTQIGRYEISRQLVDTALASVYDAFDPVERKPVAIRVPRTHHGTREITTGLHHPGLMTVLSYEQSHGAPFTVLEPFQGTPLDSLIRAGRKMEPADVMLLLRQLASVLDYAHAHGSIHGSLHPSSILLNDRNEIKVLDLGAPATMGRNASPAQLLQAIHYLSPECIRDQPMDGRSDQFSLAVLAHRLLTGELPFSGKPLGVMFRIACQGLERDSMRELPPPAQSVFQRALSKRPAERYGTCTEMVENLASGLFRNAPAATRVASVAEFAAVAAPPIQPPAAAHAGAGRHFSSEALKYFGITFVVCALVLGLILYLLFPKAPKPASAVPVAAPPAPVKAVPSSRPATSPVPNTKAAQPVVTPPPNANGKGATKAHARKKGEPEVDVKPVEPKIIRE